MQANLPDRQPENPGQKYVPMSTPNWDGSLPMNSKVATPPFKSETPLLDQPTLPSRSTEPVTQDGAVDKDVSDPSSSSANRASPLFYIAPQDTSTTRTPQGMVKPETRTPHYPSVRTCYIFTVKPVIYDH